MRELRTSEARARLTELLRAVECGETVAITRHGKAIAHHLDLALRAEAPLVTLNEAPANAAVAEGRPPVEPLAGVR